MKKEKEQGSLQKKIH